MNVFCECPCHTFPKIYIHYWYGTLGKIITSLTWMDIYVINGSLPVTHLSSWDFYSWWIPIEKKKKKREKKNPTKPKKQSNIIKAKKICR